MLEFVTRIGFICALISTNGDAFAADRARLTVDARDEVNHVSVICQIDSEIGSEYSITLLIENRGLSSVRVFDPFGKVFLAVYPQCLRLEIVNADKEIVGDLFEHYGTKALPRAVASWPFIPPQGICQSSHNLRMSPQNTRLPSGRYYLRLVVLKEFFFEFYSASPRHSSETFAISDLVPIDFLERKKW